MNERLKERMKVKMTKRKDWETTRQSRQRHDRASDDHNTPVDLQQMQTQVASKFNTKQTQAIQVLLKYQDNLLEHILINALMIHKHVVKVTNGFRWSKRVYQIWQNQNHI